MGDEVNGGILCVCFTTPFTWRQIDLCRTGTAREWQNWMSITLHAILPRFKSNHCMIHRLSAALKFTLLMEPIVVLVGVGVVDHVSRTFREKLKIAVTSALNGAFGMYPNGFSRGCCGWSVEKSFFSQLFCDNKFYSGLTIIPRKLHHWDEFLFGMHSELWRISPDAFFSKLFSAVSG